MHANARFSHLKSIEKTRVYCIVSIYKFIILIERKGTTSVQHKYNLDMNACVNYYLKLNCNITPKEERGTNLNFKFQSASPSTWNSIVAHVVRFIFLKIYICV